MCVCAGCEKIKRGCFLLLRRRNFPCCTRCVLCALWMLCVCALRPGPTVDTQFSVLFSLVCCRWIKHFHGLWADSERASERAASNLRIKCVLHTSHTAPGNATYAWCVFKVCVYAMHNGRQRQYTCGYATDCVCVWVFVCTCMMYACARLLFATEMWHSKNPFHCCLQIIDVDCLNEMFAVHYLLLLLFAQHKFYQTL